MNNRQSSTIAGVFEDRESARQAVRALRDAGFSESTIGVAGSGDQSQGTLASEDSTIDSMDDTNAGTGAATGAIAGAGIGALWGLGILAGMLPAIGPVIAGGTLAALVSSAAVGAAAAGLAGALIGMGFPKEEAEFYESEMRSGRTIVTVDAGSRREEALAIIRRHGGYDMASRSSMSSGANATTAGSRMGASSDATSTRSTTSQPRASTAASNTRVDDKTRIQAHEERLDIQKNPVETGEVKVRKEAHTEHKTLEVPVTREEVVIERRRASGGEVSADSLAPGQEVRIPVREEQVNVNKETVVAEEVAVGKRKVQDTKRVDETLRKEEIKVEKRGNANVKDER